MDNLWKDGVMVNLVMATYRTGRLHITIQTMCLCPTIFRYVITRNVLLWDSLNPAQWDSFHGTLVFYNVIYLYSMEVTYIHKRFLVGLVILGEHYQNCWNLLIVLRVVFCWHCISNDAMMGQGHKEQGQSHETYLQFRGERELICT